MKNVAPIVNMIIILNFLEQNVVKIKCLQQILKVCSFVNVKLQRIQISMICLANYLRAGSFCEEHLVYFNVKQCCCKT